MAPKPTGPVELFASERDLYPLVERYLSQGFFDRLKPRFGSLMLVSEIIATTKGSPGGKWSRPDLAAVAVRKHKYEPRPTVDLFSFEVKKNSPVDLDAVHEALAHGRLVNYCFLVWNRSAESHGDENFERVMRSCEAHGVGLIVAHNPRALDGFRIEMMARRMASDAEMIDEFIQERFSPENQSKVLRSIEALSTRSS